MVLFPWQLDEEEPEILHSEYQTNSPSIETKARRYPLDCDPMVCTIRCSVVHMYPVEYEARWFTLFTPANTRPSHSIRMASKPAGGGGLLERLLLVHLVISSVVTRSFLR